MINAPTPRTVRLALMAVAIVIIAATAPVLFHFSALYARVYEDRRFPALSRYALEPTPNIVLVGSSMTSRLYEGYFKTPLRNIATSGGSPLTGLAIVASYPSLPRVVLVETNVMSRTIERDLVEQYGEALAGYGVDVDGEALWTQYRRDAYAGIVMSVIASQIVGTSERSEAMFAAMATRHSQHALDLDSESLL